MWGDIPSEAPPAKAGARVEGSKDVMRSDSTEQNTFLHKLKRHSVVISDTQFPDIANAFHLLDVERGMTWVREEPFKYRGEFLLDFSGKVLKILFEALGAEELHQRCRSVISSLILLNRFTRPFRISSSASCSPACHSFVQK